MQAIVCEKEIGEIDSYYDLEQASFNCYVKFKTDSYFQGGEAEVRN